MAAALHVAEVVGDEANCANLFTMARGTTNDERAKAGSSTPGHGTS